MDTIVRLLSILAVTFLAEFALYNIIKPDFPKIPGDFRFEKYGFSLQIPFISPLIISAVATVYLNFLR